MSEPTVRLTTGQALVRWLAAQWSERDGEQQRAIPAMFGIFGHGQALGLGQALAQEGAELPLYQPKNEQAMVHTALGYAKAARRLQTLACTASIGPGATNMLTGAATATVNRLPVLLLPADTFASRRSGVVLQQLEHPMAGDVSVNDAFRPLSVFFDRVARPEQLLTALPEAMRVLLEPATAGAVTVALHQDALGESADFPRRFFDRRVWPVTRRPPATSELDAAAAVLAGARRPLIIAGGGVRYSGAEAALADFAAATGIPVAETSAGKGVLPSALGGIGVNGSGAANRIAEQADVVACIGTRLTDFTTGSHSRLRAPGGAVRRRERLGGGRVQALGHAGRRRRPGRPGRARGPRRAGCAVVSGGGGRCAPRMGRRAGRRPERRLAARHDAGRGVRGAQRGGRSWRLGRRRRRVGARRSAEGVAGA